MTRTGTRFRVGYVVTLAAGVAIGLALAGSATAAPSAHAQPKTVTHHLALAASAFAPDSLGVQGNYLNILDPTRLRADGAGGFCFSAGLPVPVGAKLVSVTFYYTAGSSSMRMELNRQTLATHTYGLLAVTNTAKVTTPTYTSTTLGIAADMANVNYSKDAYSAGVCPAGNTTFSGLIITYTQQA